MKDSVPAGKHTVRPEPIDSESSEDTMLRSMDAKDTPKDMKKSGMIIFTVYVVLIALGVGTGYLLAAKSPAGSPLAPKGATINTSNVVGVQDASTFKDCATGKLEKGGVQNEGTHRLIRDGGPSQTAYLISSVIDLDQYAGSTVKVCGQTLAAKKVSWLMDVGRLELQGK